MCLVLGEDDEEKRIVRMVALEAWKCQNKVKWVKI